MGEIDLEKYSSAFTLSDMEIFVFPELMYSLLLANIMSPAIWKWRDEACFRKLEGKDPYKKLMRLRQFIMDEFEFNLDLQTWGRTDKNTEIKRFGKFLPPEEISKSNALFGYEGDSYYYDVDIRKHFGLDKFNGDIIPYWKIETVEAMNAFRHKAGYRGGAGECVSLSTLYAAAAFIVCGIPLDDIYMVLTPLHSQNFIDINDGVITNNRRLVTKAMWFNGTELSNKAQRALRKEQITIVAHSSGLVHCLYKDATIDKKIYDKFTSKLGDFLNFPLEAISIAGFLRSSHNYQKYFQFCRDCRGVAQFVKAEILFHYEHESNFRICDSTHEKLLTEVDEEDFSNTEYPGRIRCDQFKEYMGKQRPDIRTEAGRKELAKVLSEYIGEAEKFINELYDFLHIEPKLPAGEKNYTPSEPIKITADMSREEIIDYLQSIRGKNTTADLAFYAYRDMESCDWRPFVKSAIERSPVSIEMAKDKTIEQCYEWLKDMPNESIYDGKRVAQPDEVANYGRGDGIEKAITLANILHKREAGKEVTIRINGGSVVVEGDKSYQFESSKGFSKEIKISKENYEVV
ncbi:MAG: hypothetical protein KKE31_06540 [Planctomycetes bacterium]|nr:hypothetical protein [Planctomycetota bacterium]MBU1518830.1 hypothetical protein [Planctomycetota bacterium]MBU2458266.1 hypothetical protein [Planctomycetota bacterium]